MDVPAGAVGAKGRTCIGINLDARQMTEARLLESERLPASSSTHLDRRQVGECSSTNDLVRGTLGSVMRRLSKKSMPDAQSQSLTREPPLRTTECPGRMTP